MPAPKPKAMHPRDFKVNGSWLAYCINRAPIHVDGQEIDLYILQDAASMYIFGNAFAPRGSDYPSEADVEKLMRSAHEKNEEWPIEIVLPGVPDATNSFAKVAKQHGIAVRTVPESQMSIYIKDAQDSYEEFLLRGNASDA
jgi:hypothetical protein